jgi:glycosyltransferase involved in cell wall biosynthesis
MKVFTHNFNPQSNSGPNKFTRTLFNRFIKEKDVLISNQEEADVEFCLIQQQLPKVKPMVLRLDGIYFNSEQEYNKQNALIQYSYNNADAVVFQSEFNKKLTETWFGKHENSHIIHNAADVKLINSINRRFWDDKLGEDTEVWCCASSWRPHKRLLENVRYFLECAPSDAIFAIAGGLGMDEAKEILSIDPRIRVLGELDYGSLLALYRKSSTFVHLAYLDHCPNVVVDAQASGCKIVCSSTGGTQEVVNNGICILEEEWDMKPCKLYSPPSVDFSKTHAISREPDNNFEKCVDTYYNLLSQTARKYD